MRGTCLHAEVSFYMVTIRGSVTARRRGNLMRLLHFARNDNLTFSLYVHLRKKSIKIVRPRVKIIYT
jgi:hypothetical protein